ncbi:hypothetical protein G7Y89_g13772 [Cudoniella acicularis]|uniref:Uncharacterized protein n=1 Tax=Cudoniella acicularis TaxID=354080 RepID=A0A8H4R911_9HELO|nr:hypothetical protein G7Y89_g13772 [Cudoniella acicularis]
MSPAITFTEADHALMVAIINQLGVGKIDKRRLQLDLGLASIKTAESRLFRFKAKLANGKGENPPSPAKAKRVSPKKRKLDESDEEDMKIEAEDHDSHFGDGMSSSTLDPPMRKMPERKGRAISFKKEVIEYEADDDSQDSGRN